MGDSQTFQVFFRDPRPFALIHPPDFQAGGHILQHRRIKEQGILKYDGNLPSIVQFTAAIVNLLSIEEQFSLKEF
ncbi:MAG: hypothetical protein A4E66_01818 [Syntrophus sp. PtaB.Bin001]|nr:MAG: hypothetical protein A4E66_01818 [Syntrophus sp. PtaB.Bin001]